MKGLLFSTDSHLEEQTSLSMCVCMREDADTQMCTLYISVIGWSPVWVESEGIHTYST